MVNLCAGRQKSYGWDRIVGKARIVLGIIRKDLEAAVNRRSECNTRLRGLKCVLVDLIAKFAGYVSKKVEHCCRLRQPPNFPVTVEMDDDAPGRVLNVSMFVREGFWSRVNIAGLVALP
jgi:hypothetical protein